MANSAIIGYLKSHGIGYYLFGSELVAAESYDVVTHRVYYSKVTGFSMKEVLQFLGY